MNDPKPKTDIQEAKALQKYSTDYDQTLVIRYVFTLLAVFMFALIFLEIMQQRFADADATHRGYLTPEIVHTIFGFIGGAMTVIVNSFFTKKLAEQAQKDASQAQKDKAKAEEQLKEAQK